MSFLQFFRTLWAGRLIIAITTGACFLAGLIATFLLPVEYRAESRVMLELIKPDPVTGEAISSSFARAYIPTQTELIRDYRVTGRVVDNLGWTTSREMHAHFEADGNKEGMDFRRWLAQPVGNSTYAYAIENSNVLAISYSSDNPDNAARMANAVRDAYVQESLAAKRGAAETSAKWFENQVVKIRNELAAAEARKVAFERANRIVLQEDDSDAESRRLQALSGQVSLPVPVGGGGTGSTAQIAQIDARIATESTSLGPNHPVIQDLKRQREALVSAAASERAQSRVSMAGPSIASQLAGQRDLVLAQRDKVEEARRLQADVTVLRDHYAKTMARVGDLKQQAASTDAGVTMLADAIPPRKPDSPNIPVLLLGSLGLGLGLGVLLALIVELLNRRVRSVEDLERAGVPVLVILSASPGSHLAHA